MAENVTAKQACDKLNQLSKEWIEKDLEKGIVLPFQYWKGGQYKNQLSFVLWRSLILPVVLALVLLTVARMMEWLLFAILLICYIIYLVIGVAIRKRKNGNFLLKPDGLTMITSEEKILIPWESITEVSYKFGGVADAFEQVALPSYRFGGRMSGAYHLRIKTKMRAYEFFEVYAKGLVTDSDGRLNPAMMPLHIIFKVVQAAISKV